MEEIRLPPFTAARDLRAALPDTAAVEVAPGAARRRRVPEEGPGGVVEESILALRRLPGVVLQWAWHPGGDDGDPEADAATNRRPLAVDWRLPPGAVPDLPTSAFGPLTVQLPETDARIRVHARGPQVRWQDGSTARGHRAGLTADLDPHAPLTLLFVLDSGSGIGTSATLRRLTSLDSELEARASDERRAAERELNLDVENPAVTEAFRWARSRLHGALVHPGGRRPGVLRTGSSDREDRAVRASDSELARIGTGILALGRHESAGELMAEVPERLKRGPEAWQPSGRDAYPHGAAGLLELLGRYVLWTGDGAPLDRLGDELEAWFGTRAETPGRRAAIRTGLVECAEAVEAAGDRGRADHLRGLLHGEAEGNGEELEVAGAEAANLHGGSVEWTRRIEERLREDGAGSPDLSALAETGRLVAWLLFGLLGARGDAFYGRLRLAPRIPRQWHRLTVGGIRVADARVHLSYHESEGQHTFRLEPTGGRVPLNLVFEPLLPVSVMARAWVDGEPAEVDRYRRDGRIGARLQLPLDGVREVVLEEGGAGGGRGDEPGPSMKRG